MIQELAKRRQPAIIASGILQGKKPVAEPWPRLPVKRLGALPDLLRSLSHLTPEEAKHFAEDIDRAREDMDAEAPKSPWESGSALSADSGQTAEPNRA